MVLLRCHPTVTPLTIAMTWTCRPQQNTEASENSDEGAETDDEDSKQTMRTFFEVFWPHTSQAHGMQAEKTIKVWP